jgi:hypothetical protein
MVYSIHTSVIEEDKVDSCACWQTHPCFLQVILIWFFLSTLLVHTSTHSIICFIDLGSTRAFGIDENTAIVIRGPWFNREGIIIGERGVLLLDISDALVSYSNSANTGNRLSLTGVSIRFRRHIHSTSHITIDLYQRYDREQAVLGHR